MTKLDEKFKKAYQITSNMTEKLPPDIMLKLYAYYKQATRSGNFKHPTTGENPLREAFKLNAWFQINTLSEKEAKQNYIDLVDSITNQKNK